MNVHSRYQSFYLYSGFLTCHDSQHPLRTDKTATYENGNQSPQKETSQSLSSKNRPENLRNPPSDKGAIF